jgi:uncharacterized membrane protein
VKSRQGKAKAWERRARQVQAADDAVDDFFEGALELDVPDSGDGDIADMPAASGKGLPKRRFPGALKVFGALLLVTCGIAVALIVLVAGGIVMLLLNGGSGTGSLSGMSRRTLTVASLAISIIQICFYLLIILVGWRLGWQLLHDKRHKVGASAHALVGLYAVTTVCDLMLTGLDIGLFVNIAIMIFLETLSVYADPALRSERELQRRLGRMELRTEAEQGTLGLDTTGAGYIKLNFFNLFWIFVVCCFLGWGIETVYHMTVVDPGVYQERAGLLYGPLSPIYGVGGTLLTMFLNRFQKKNVLIIFLVSAVVGGAFEYFVSWFMQFSFGITAWDYTGTFLSIDGRTNGQFMAMWGLLGVVWIKAFLPLILKLVNKIPWNWRYAVTTVCAVLMLADALLTLSSLDCWYQREAGTMAEQQLTVIDDFCNEHYDNEFMQQRFQSMSMDTSSATRIN